MYWKSYTFSYKMNIWKITELDIDLLLMLHEITRQTIHLFLINPANKLYFEIREKVKLVNNIKGWQLNGRIKFAFYFTLSENEIYSSKFTSASIFLFSLHGFFENLLFLLSLATKWARIHSQTLPTNLDL